jgi:hypothetical protein
MTMVVNVPGRVQRRHVAAAKGALVRKAQFGPAVLMANRFPLMMSLHTRTGATPTQQRCEWVQAMIFLCRWNSTRRGPRPGLTSHFPPDDL